MPRSKLLLLILLTGILITAQVAAAQSILFDNTHGERFAIGEKGPLQLSGLADLCLSAGARVATLDKPISDATLAGVDGLVISGAFAPLQGGEVEAVMRFMQRGGKVAVMLHIAPPLRSLLDRLQISYTNGVIQEKQNVIEGNPLNFRVTRLGSHPVLQGVPQFSLYGVWGLMNRDDSSRIVAASSPDAWIDLYNDKIQRKEATASFGVAVAGEVGKGGFIVFGDDAIFQNKFLDDTNKTLAGNLARWLN
jgi:hypothetical protein